MVLTTFSNLIMCSVDVRDFVLVVRLRDLVYSVRA